MIDSVTRSLALASMRRAVSSMTAARTRRRARIDYDGASLSVDMINGSPIPAHAAPTMYVVSLRSDIVSPPEPRTLCLACLHTLTCGAVALSVNGHVSTRARIPARRFEITPRETCIPCDVCGDRHSSPYGDASLYAQRARDAFLKFCISITTPIPSV